MVTDRTTVSIQVAVQECDPGITDEELRLCIAAQSQICHSIRRSLIDLIESIREGKPEVLLKMKAEFAWQTVERMFEASKTPPKQWLGPKYTPGTPEQINGLRVAKAIFTAATGEALP